MRLINSIDKLSLIFLLFPESNYPRPHIFPSWIILCIIFHLPSLRFHFSLLFRILLYKIPFYFEEFHIFEPNHHHIQRKLLGYCTFPFLLLWKILLSLCKKFHFEWWTRHQDHLLGRFELFLNKKHENRYYRSADIQLQNRWVVDFFRCLHNSSMENFSTWF